MWSARGWGDTLSGNDQFLVDQRVAVHLCAPGVYDGDLTIALRKLTQQLGWGDQSTGAFSKVIPSGCRVIVKPNFVLHENQGPWSFEAVITHPSLVRRTVEDLLLTGADEVAVGDAPVQGCDFAQLLQRTGLGSWSEDLTHRDPRFKGISDFRRTASVFKHGVRYAVENRVDASRYVLFDLGPGSLLEPVTSDEPRFRVTCYDPKFLSETHHPGRHQYLITRDVLEADVVVNLPKLKMHCKAGVTNALKNLVGINGNKEYLPHHRLGGTADSGDCYPGKSRIKAIAEGLYDFRNSSASVARSRVVRQALKPLNAILKLRGEDTSLEGAWSGNDTVWRMTLDLNRILIYGKTDGTMSDVPQRKILHVSDGIIAGQGRGPLSPQPFSLGVISAAENPAALDCAGAHLLGLDPAKIPLLQGAFAEYRWPVAHFAAESVMVIAENREFAASRLATELSLSKPEHIPAGWRSAVSGIDGPSQPNISLDSLLPEASDG
jgi:uncharacterized protein (DUF362 family)